MGLEIEKKFLITQIPKDLESYPSHHIEQAYLNKVPVIRVRKSDDDYYMTYKGKGLLEREEYNLPLTKESFEHLREKADGSVIKKTRYVIPYGELNIELDIFDYPAGLVMAEVEFPSLVDADAFVKPDWFGEEVTQDPKYHNVNMI